MLEEFDFELPEDRIALEPVTPRDSSRLLLVYGDGKLEDRLVSDLPDILQAGDLLVGNNTRVIAAALKGIRPARDAQGSDVSADVNLLERLSEAEWSAFARPGKRLHQGDIIQFGANFSAKVIEKRPDGQIILFFDKSGSELDEAIEQTGNMPLPPYIARRRGVREEDRADYQTVYADKSGSVAAPTAGLHFTQDLIERLSGRGVDLTSVTLNVGAGTFAPVSEADLKAGRLHEETYIVPENAALQIQKTKAAAGRIIPIGTTSLRTLEAVMRSAGRIDPCEGATDIFLKPGDDFQITDALMTNFHLPKSTLFMLVCALMGTKIMQAAYAHAVREKYRFYSYGDACLLMPGA